MALPACRRCGKRDPQRMFGLMSLWFGPLIELEADLGYFYLCPACHDEVIAPELERIQNRILELHPAAQRHLEQEHLEAEPEDEAEPVTGSESGVEGDPEAGADTGPEPDAGPGAEGDAGAASDPEPGAAQ